MNNTISMFKSYCAALQLYKLFNNALLIRKNFVVDSGFLCKKRGMDEKGWHFVAERSKTNGSLLVVWRLGLARTFQRDPCLK